MQNLSGIFSRNFDNQCAATAQQETNRAQPFQANPSSSVIVDNQNDSFAVHGVGKGLLNQTDGSIHQIASPPPDGQSFQNEMEAQTILNPNTDHFSRSPNPNLNVSMHDNGALDTSNNDL